MLVRSRLRLRRRGGGAASGGGGGGISNTVLPSFIQPNGSGGWEPADPVDTNPDVFVGGSVWSGGTPPYLFDHAIYNAADDSVIVARGSEDEVDLGTMTGLTIYAREWCIDALGNEAFADTPDFGPIAAGFAATMIGRYDFRSTIDYVTSPPEVFVVAGAGQGAVAPSGSSSGLVAYDGMAAVSGDGSDWADCGGTGSSLANRTLLNGTTGAGARMAGRWGFGTSSSHFAVKLPNGWYRFRLLMGDPLTTIASVRVDMRNGPNSGDPSLFSTTLGHSSSEMLCLSEAGGATVAVAVAKNEIKDWIGGGVNDGLWSAPMQVTGGAVRFQRQDIGTTGTGYIVCLDIKTAEAP